MSDYIKQPGTLLFDRSTGAAVGAVDLNGNEQLGLGGAGGGVPVGDVGDLTNIGSVGSPNLVLDPALYTEDLGSILNSGPHTGASEISVGSFLVPAGWAVGRTLEITVKITPTGATAKSCRARLGSAGGATACTSGSFTSSSADVHRLLITRTAGTDASATLVGAGAGGGGAVTAQNVTGAFPVHLMVQPAAAENITVDWAKARLV